MSIYQSNFYVYAYLREDGTPYYIGKGKDQRAFKKNKNERKKPPSDPSLIRILESDLSEDVAFECEKYWIEFYGRKDIGTGILRNMTDGGEGCSGLVQSDEHRKAISDARKADWATNDELRKSISDQMKGNNYGKNKKGWNPTDETRSRMSESAKKRSKIYVECDLCGKVVTLNNLSMHKRFRHKEREPKLPLVCS